MGIDSTVLLKLRQLPPEDQEKVAQLVESLAAAMAKRPRKDPMGMFAHHAVDMPLEMFEEARREAWAGFPREFPEPGSP